MDEQAVAESNQQQQQHNDDEKGEESEKKQKEPTPGEKEKKHLENKKEEDDDDCVIVSEQEFSGALEVPLDSNGNLGLSTLSHSFPDAIGLKYKNPDTGLFRTLGLNPEGNQILPPKGGWRGKRFLAIFRKTNNNGNMTEVLKRGPIDYSEQKSYEGKKCLDEERSTKTCDMVVLNVAFQTTADQLKDYFSHFGEVMVAEVKKDFRTGEHKGFGFVRMRTMGDQQRILDQFEHFIDGRMTQVKIPNSRMQEEENNASKRPKEVISSKVHIGRLPSHAVETDLRRFFDVEAKKLNANAKVDQVYLPIPHRGFAFVSFNDAAVAQQMGDYIMDGFSISVSSAARQDPKEERKRKKQLREGHNDYNKAPPRHMQPRMPIAYGQDSCSNWMPPPPAAPYYNHNPPGPVNMDHTGYGHQHRHPSQIQYSRRYGELSMDSTMDQPVVLSWPTFYNGPSRSPFAHPHPHSSSSSSSQQ